MCTYVLLYEIVVSRDVLPKLRENVKFVLIVLL